MSRLKGFDNEMEDDWDLLNIPPPTEPFEYSDRAIESIALDFCIEQISFDEAKLIKSVDTLNYYNQLLNEYIADFHLHNYLRIEPTLDAYLNRHRMQKPTDYIL